MADDEEIEDLDEEISNEEVASAPSDTADPQDLVNAKIPQDIRDKYEIYSYRNAAVILAESHAEEFSEVMQALRDFSITTSMIRTAGGNESDIPKLLSRTLRPLGWHETVIQGDLLVQLLWREQVRTTKG